MTTIEHSIDVSVPVDVAYGQWADVSSFPSFLEGIERVEQVSETRTHWVTGFDGVRREFDVEMTDQVPDKRVAWRSVDDQHYGGAVEFAELPEGHTRVVLRIDAEPEKDVDESFTELSVSSRVKGDLGRFKDYIEIKHTDVSDLPTRKGTMHPPTGRGGGG